MLLVRIIDVRSEPNAVLCQADTINTDISSIIATTFTALN